MIASICAWEVANPESIPSEVTSRSWWFWRRPARMRLAAADTAGSRASSGRSPPRVSRNTVALPCQGSSSWRTIKWS